MADIAFLLLIFFLVTTTMDTDTGLLRGLPPMPDEDQPPPEDTQVRDRNVLEIFINNEDLIRVEGQIMPLSEIREFTKYFITNPDDDSSMSEKEPQEIPYFGEVMVSQAIISLQNHRGTTYSVYIAVQNELLAARDELRDEISIETWGIPYENLETSRQRAVDQYYFAPISEAEPRRTGGRR